MERLLFTDVCQTKKLSFIFTDIIDSYVFLPRCYRQTYNNRVKAGTTMNKNSLKDDELENVNGGRRWEIRGLQDALGISDLEEIKSILLKHEIDADLSKDQDNTYVNVRTGELIKHEQVIDLIKKNNWC